MTTNILYITAEHDAARIRLRGNMSVAFEDAVDASFVVKLFTTTNEVFLLESSQFRFRDLQGNLVDGLAFGEKPGQFIELMFDPSADIWYITANNLLESDGGGAAAELPLVFEPLPNATTFDMNVSSNRRATITAGAKLANPINMKPGDFFRLIIVQGTGGNFALSYDTAYSFFEATPPLLSTATGVVDVLTGYMSADGSIICDLHKNYSIVTVLAHAVNGYHYSMTNAIAAAQAHPENGQNIRVVRKGWRLEVNSAIGFPATSFTNMNLRVRGETLNSGALMELRLDKADRPAFGKALINIEGGKYVAIEDLQIAGASAYNDGNGTGILVNGGVEYVRIKNVILKDNENGIRSTNNTQPFFDMEDVLLEKNGWAANAVHLGQSHSIYGGWSKQIRSKRVTFYNPVAGHNYKSRAYRNILRQVYVRKSDNAREMDIPDQGIVHVYDSVFWKEASANQNNVIGIGHECLDGYNRVQEYFFINCYFHNDVENIRGVSWLDNKARNNPNTVPVHFIDCEFGGTPNSKLEQFKDSIMLGPYTITLTGGPVGPRVPVGDTRRLFNMNERDPKRTTNPLNIPRTPFSELPPMSPELDAPPYPAFQPLDPLPPIPVFGTPSGPDETAPTIILAQSVVTNYPSQILTLSATVADNVGVTKVEFYRDSELISTATNFPHQITQTFTESENGQVVLYHAVAYDAADNSTESNDIIFTVDIQPPPPDTIDPTIELSASHTTVVSNRSITLTAISADDVGVTKVEFYRDAVLVGTDISSPYTYSVTLSHVDNGSINFTAKAYDGAGNIKTSEVVTVVVNIPFIKTKPTTRLDQATQNEYRAAINNATIGNKRERGGLAIASAMESRHRLHIYQDGVLIIPIEFNGNCTVINDGHDIYLQTSTAVDSSAAIMSANILTGNWWYELQGGENFSRVLCGSVGAIGSNAEFIISENITLDQGFDGNFRFVIPRVVDDLS